MKHEIQNIGKKFMKADYPRPFINSVISQYSNKIKEQEIDNDDASIVHHFCLKIKNRSFYQNYHFVNKMN